MYVRDVYGKTVQLACGEYGFYITPTAAADGAERRGCFTQQDASYKQTQTIHRVADVVDIFTCCKSEFVGIVYSIHVIFISIIPQNYP